MRKKDGFSRIKGFLFKNVAGFRIRSKYFRAKKFECKKRTNQIKINSLIVIRGRISGTKNESWKQKVFTQISKNDLGFLVIVIPMRDAIFRRFDGSIEVSFCRCFFPTYFCQHRRYISRVAGNRTIWVKKNCTNFFYVSTKRRRRLWIHFYEK